MGRKKQLKELTIKDNFMFGAAVSYNISEPTRPY